MAELLEQIKKMSREEQQALVDQIYVLQPETEIVEDEIFVEELRRRADRAIHNPQSRTSWATVKARLIAQQNEQEQRG